MEHHLDTWTDRKWPQYALLKDFGTSEVVRLLDSPVPQVDAHVAQIIISSHSTASMPARKSVQIATCNAAIPF